MVGRTIIVALDDSVHSEIAFKFFADNIYREGDVVILVHCVESHRPSPFSAPGMLLGAMEHVRLTTDDLNADSLQMVAKMREMLTKRNILGTALRVDGKAGEAIIRVSQERKADMIITGSRGRRFFWRPIFGSVSDYVLHHSRVPVLICKH